MPHTRDGMPLGSGGPLYQLEWSCLPIDPSPVGFYQPCVWYDHPWSGYDNCGDEAFCEDWDADGQGECKGFCIEPDESWDGYRCQDPMAFAEFGCSDGCFCICERLCDPLDVAACEAGDLCWPYGKAFTCRPYELREPVLQGGVCDYETMICSAGLACLAGEYVADCVSDTCCTPFCDVSQPNACPGKAGGETCMPWFLGPTHPSLENLGVCGVPQ